LASSKVDAPTIRVVGERRRFVVGFVVPPGIVALAYLLWWISDRLVNIGPLDRAAFGWVVVIPVWLSAPIVAGLVWQRLTPRQALEAAFAVGGLVSVIAALLFWQSVAYPDCATGAIRAPIEWFLPAVIVGWMVGAGLIVSGLLATAQFRAGRPWRAVLFGGGAELVLVLGAVLATAVFLIGPACQRPAV
jgi:hypothetical protein